MLPAISQLNFFITLFVPSELQYKNNYMDSIFQIKINQHKLQRIINELLKDQTRLSTQLQFHSTQIQAVPLLLSNLRKDIDSKLQILQSKLAAQLKDLSTDYQQKVVQIERKLSYISQANMIKYDQLNTVIKQSREETEKNSEKQGKFEAKLSEMVQKLGKIQEIDPSDKQKEKERSEKIKKIEKMVGKTLQMTELLQNQNFIYFLQMLVDKQQANQKIAQQLKDIKNPFNVQSNEEKAKRFRDIKKALQDTHHKIQEMQEEYTGYFQTAKENNKQNREQTNMHYAFISSRLNNLQSKMKQYSTLIQSTVVERILYPSENKDKKEKLISKEKIEIQQVVKNNLLKNKDEIVTLIKQQIQISRAHEAQLKRNEKTKQDQLEDHIWTLNSKIQNIKESMLSNKVQIERFHEKIKLISYHFHSNEKDSVTPRTTGENLNQLRMMQQRLEDLLDSKLDINCFNKSGQQLHQKIKIVSQRIQEKANRQETRRAFTFLQEKIKQIITLMADMSSSQKKTAGRKKMVQCLSCDDNFFQQLQMNQILSSNTGRASNPFSMPNKVNSAFNIKNRQKNKVNRTSNQEN